MAGIVIAMFVLDRWLALASVLVVPIMLWFTNFVARYTRRGFRDLQKYLGEMNGVMEEAISGQKVVKAFRRNDSVVDAFRERNQAVYQAGVYANSYALLLMPLTNVLGNFFVIVLAGLGGWLALQGLVSVGLIATFIIYGQNFIQPLRQLANMYNTIQAALAGAERVFEIIDTPGEIDEASTTTAITPATSLRETLHGDVKFDHVRFGYQPDQPIIKDMTLEACAGQTIALVGPTGAGKTTIINLLTRFYEIDGGQITIDGTDIRDMPQGRSTPAVGIGFAGHVPVRRHGAGEHPLWTARCHRRGMHAGRKAGRCRSLHPPVAARLSNAVLRTREQPEPGAAAAALDCARHPGRSRHPDSGRSDEQCRYAHRSAHSEIAAAADAGPHQLRDRAPPQHHPRCRRSGGHQSTARSSSGARTSSCSISAGSIITCMSASSRARRFDLTPCPFLSKKHR